MHPSGGDLNNGGDCACVGAEGICEMPVPTLQFCCESKTT